MKKEKRSIIKKVIGICYLFYFTITSAWTLLDLWFIKIKKKKYEPDEIKKLISGVFDRERVFLAIKLNLKKIPSLIWKDKSTDGAIMRTTFTKYTDGGWFRQKITKTEPTYEIEVYLQDLADYFSRLYGDLHGSVHNYAIAKFLLTHEFRHVWQAENDFFNGQSEHAALTNVLLGHGELPEEKDANEFAFSLASKKDEDLFRYLIECQVQKGKWNSDPTQAEKYRQRILLKGLIPSKH